ncbi:MAG: transposase [Bryobacteraceae bacterium]|nr:transposase [Bryobacteraceae bacterium]
MPHHVHLVALPQHPDSFARTFPRVHSEYARAIHMRLRRVGHLWQARYGSTPVDETHFRAALLSVEQNPVLARLVARPAHAGDLEVIPGQRVTGGRPDRGNPRRSPTRPTARPRSVRQTGTGRLEGGLPGRTPGSCDKS